MCVFAGQKIKWFFQVSQSERILNMIVFPFDKAYYTTHHDGFKYSFYEIRLDGFEYSWQIIARRNLLTQSSLKEDFRAKND